MAAKLPIPTASSPSLEEREAARARDERIAVWGFLWTLFAFKIATVVLIFYADQTAKATFLLAATTWYFLPLPIVAVAGLLLFRYRLLKVRRRRQQLRRAEWLLDDGGEAHGAAHPP